MVESRSWRGIAALSVAVIMWASFALTIRGIGSSSLTPADVALMRFGTPAVLLAPWIPRALRQLRSEKPLVLVLLAAGGLPHFLLSAWGGQLTSASLVGILLPGTAPLFVAAILWMWKRQRQSGPRVAALVVIVLGIGVTAALTSSSATLAGIAILLGGGCAWAIYSIGLRDTRLDLTSVALVVCVPAATCAALLGLTGLPSHLFAGTARLSDVVLFVVFQGIGTGIVSTFAYAYAVRMLGSATAATWGALSPVLTTLAAVPLLGEGITPAAVAALILIVGGVVAYNTVSLVPRRRHRPRALPKTKAPLIARSSDG